MIICVNHRKVRSLMSSLTFDKIQLVVDFEYCREYIKLPKKQFLLLMCQVTHVRHHMIVFSRKLTSLNHLLCMNFIYCNIQVSIKMYAHQNLILNIHLKFLGFQSSYFFACKSVNIIFHCFCQSQAIGYMDGK